MNKRIRPNTKVAEIVVLHHMALTSCPDFIISIVLILVVLLKNFLAAVNNSFRFFADF